MHDKQKRSLVCDTANQHRISVSIYWFGCILLITPNECLLFDIDVRNGSNARLVNLLSFISCMDVLYLVEVRSKTWATAISASSRVEIVASCASIGPSANTLHANISKFR
jgi:hypothetical protein